MRHVFLAFAAATLAFATPVSAQTATSGASSAPSATGGHAPLAAATTQPSKAAIEADKRMMAEQKRLERIMTICTGC